MSNVQTVDLQEEREAAPRRPGVSQSEVNGSKEMETWSFHVKLEF